MSRLDNCHNVFDLREAARRRLPGGVFEFVDRATEDELALRNNRAAFENVRLRHRALVDVSGRSTRTTLFGKEIALPMAIAPTGAAGLCWHEGELELARAAARMKIPFTLATGAMTSMEKIAKEANFRLWFQLYVWKRRELPCQLTGRATLYGTAVGGEAGAFKAARIIQAEMDKTMACTGCNRVEEIGTDIFFRGRESNRLAG